MVSVPERRIGRLILAPQLSQSQLRAWFAAFRAAWQDVGSASDTNLVRFRTALAEHAADAGLRTEADEFFRYLDAQGSRVDESVIRTTVDEGDRLPEIHQALEPVGWVTDEQWDQLDELWGEDWPGVLESRLKERWAQTQPSSDDERRDWLDYLIPEFVHGSADVDPDSSPLPGPEAVAADLFAVALAAKEALERELGRPLDLSPQDLLTETARTADAVAAAQSTAH